jgi:hypothetical protein
MTISAAGSKTFGAAAAFFFLFYLRINGFSGISVIMRTAIVVLTIMTVSALFSDFGLGQDLFVFPA